MMAQNSVPVNQAGVERFHWISENFDPVALEKMCQGITQMMAIHPKGDMNLCTKFHGHSSDSC